MARDTWAFLRLGRRSSQLPTWCVAETPRRPAGPPRHERTGVRRARPRRDRAAAGAGEAGARAATLLARRRRPRQRPPARPAAGAGGPAVPAVLVPAALALRRNGAGLRAPAALRGAVRRPGRGLGVGLHHPGRGGGRAVAA